MTVEQARTIAEELRGRFGAPFSLTDKERIAMLHKEVLGRPFRPTTCQQCYHDALILIYNYLKRHNKMAEKSNYSLRAGFIIKSPAIDNGKIYTNANLTDEVAEKYLELFPAQKDMFATIPTKPVKAANEEEADAVTQPPKKGKKKAKK